MRMTALITYACNASQSIPLIVVSSQLLCWTACTGRIDNEVEHPETLPRAYIAQPCEALRSAPPNKPPVSVYVEVASVHSRLGEPLGEYLAANAVEADQVTSLLIDSDNPVEGPWRRCNGASCADEQTGTIRIQVANFPESPSAPLDLHVTVSFPELSEERVTVRTNAQRPVIAPLTSAIPAGTTMVITPYYLPEGDGQSSLLDCKSRKRLTRG